MADPVCPLGPSVLAEIAGNRQSTYSCDSRDGENRPELCKSAMAYTGALL